MKPLRIATRRSALALWQAEHVAARLRAAHPGLEVELLPMVTQGDRILDRTLAQVGGKGLFIKELEVALQEGRADLAVHSMKDMPADLPPGLCLAAALERADPRDAFVSNRHRGWQDLPLGARLGTASLRRQCQVRALRPDLEVQPLRGNVNTRLAKLDAGEFAGILLACAGLERLGFQSRISEALDPEILVPAVGQGIIGIECREEDAFTRATVATLDDPLAALCLATERAFSAALAGSCQSPVAGHAALTGGRLRLNGLVGAPDGSRRVAGDAVLELGDASQSGLRAAIPGGEGLGRGLAERLLAAGAAELLAAAAAAHS
ncbi:MAG: hydroxymethylbilane synthase [Gammaproteobacteria bacterium]